MEAFLQQLDFELDEFQKDAIRVISEGHSVVVCAPTGSGKTIIAEYAASQAIERGVKMFYTTPLKALSNQKYFDLKNRYGEQNVGLLTGDLSLNREARIVVMTTEVFRNMLYGLNEDRSLLANIGYAVLDECHFMNDAERGTVWEESIIYCPPSIQLIALSATVANAEELTNWIDEVHHNTKLIVSDVRPVPLRFSYYTRESLLPLFEAPGRMNKKLKLDLKGNKFSKTTKSFRPNLLIEEMFQKEMLPGIFFTFSRKGCDQYLRDTRTLRLLNAAEKEILNRKIEDFLVQNPFLESNPMLEYIRNGFASHHAGLLPGLKHLVESLFQQGLIKVVFATETLAAGINMPARSTVITAISKRTNEGHRLLTASEFLQMSGRAGRRGLDPVGYVVVVSSPFRGAQEAATLASSLADPLNSRFTPTYGMVLNLLQKFTVEEAKFLISKSFGQFTSERRLLPLKLEIQQKTAELNDYLAFQCPANLTDKEFHNYVKGHEIETEALKRIGNLKKQVKRFGQAPELMAEIEREKGKLDNVKSTLTDVACRDCNLLQEHQRNDDRIQRLQKHIKSLDKHFLNEKETNWQSFLNIHNLLQEAEHLNADGRPTAKGALTAQIRSENELFLSEIILQGHLKDLPPASLAGVIISLLYDSTRENVFSKLQPSVQAKQALHDIAKEMKRIDKLQNKHRVQAPLNLNPLPAGLVEAWCEDLPWDRLVSSSNIDEGDLVRLIRRTADILRQMSRISEIPSELGVCAKEALKALYRDPIKEIELVEESSQDKGKEKTEDAKSSDPKASESSKDFPIESNPDLES